MMMNRVVMVMKMTEEEFHRFDYFAAKKNKMQVGRSKSKSLLNRFAICIFFC